MFGSFLLVLFNLVKTAQLLVADVPAKSCVFTRKLLAFRDVEQSVPLSCQGNVHVDHYE